MVNQSPAAHVWLTVLVHGPAPEIGDKPAVRVPAAHTDRRCGVDDLRAPRHLVAGNRPRVSSMPTRTCRPTVSQILEEVHHECPFTVGRETVGGVVSTLSTRAGLAPLVLPALSVATA